MLRDIGFAFVLALVGASIGLVVHDPASIHAYQPGLAMALGAAIGLAIVPTYRGLRHAGRGVVIDSIPVTVPLLGTLTFKMNTDHRKVGWCIFVEVATRIASQPLGAGDGSIREALTSLRTLFDLVRDQLKQMAPSPVPENQDESTVESFAIRMLNEAMRPCLSRWHPRLKTWELVSRPESDWPPAALCRADIEVTRQRVLGYAWGLGRLLQIADLAHLLPGPPTDPEPPAFATAAQVAAAEQGRNDRARRRRRHFATTTQVGAAE